MLRLFPDPSRVGLAASTVRLVGPFQGASRMGPDTQGGVHARCRSPGLALGFLVEAPTGQIGRAKALKIDN